MKIELLLASAAGLVGAAGVGLAAVAAHRVQEPALATAAYMLIFAAAAALVVSAHLRTAIAARRVWGAAGALLLAGALLFAGDISLRAVAGTRLFPMAAPLGGSSMIAGWATIAVAAIMELRAGGK